MSLEFETVEVNETTTLDIEQPKNEPQYSSSDYYKTGKKKGQLKPSAKKKLQGEQLKTEPKKEAAKSSDENVVDIDKELEALNAQYKTAEVTKSESNTNKVLVSGLMLLIICDAVFPSVIAFFYKKIKKSTKLKSKMLRLTKEEKDEMKEVADAAAKQLLMEASPLAQFVICMGSIYVGKVIELEE